MGTTAEKLQNILNAKEAIRTKFNLPDDLSFIQYADNISGGTSPDPDVPSGVNTDFFLCKSFQYEQSYPEYFDLELGIYTQLNDGSGSGTEMQLDLFQASPYLTEFTRMWSSKESGVSYQISYDFSRQLWVLKDSEGIVAESSGLLSGWYIVRGDSTTVEVKKGTVYPAYEGIRTWTGAKIVLTSDGYAVDETSTETMMQFNKSRIVQVGHIYNRDATIEAAWLYKDLEPQGIYICTYVNRNYVSYNTLVVSGFPADVFAGMKYYDWDNGGEVEIPAEITARNPNGTYVLQNPDAANSSDRIWKSENGCVIKSNRLYPDEAYADKELTFSVEREWMENDNGYPAPDDHTSYNWQKNGENIEGASVAIPVPEPVEQYWEGYKLYQDKNGKWNYDTETTRLTYGDFMPVAGRIYDAMPTMEIGNIDFSEEALWSCPRNMTGNENDEWLVSCSDYYGDRYPWKAFDDDLSTRWGHNSGAWWIQWQNKLRKVFIAQMIVYVDESTTINYEAYFQGSNDGENWVDIASGYISDKYGKGSQEEGHYKSVLTFPDNGTPYYYYRFGQKRTNFSSNFYGIIAYPQIPRTIPK